MPVLKPKDIAMFTPRIPSDAEMRGVALSWFDRCGDTLIDHWSADLAALSMPTEFVRFPLEIVEELFEPKNGIPSEGVQAFAAELDARIGWKRRFVRLNSRSPKDATWPFEVPATISGKESLSMMGRSERILDDLCMFQRIPEHPAYVCLRDWVYGFSTENEYRCFVKDNKLIAVTQYDYTKSVERPQDGGREIRNTIEKWFREVLRPTLHINTVVFDIHLNGWLADRSILLIEINPVVMKSGVCSTYGKLEGLVSQLRNAHDRLDQALMPVRNTPAFPPEIRDE